MEILQALPLLWLKQSHLSAKLHSLVFGVLLLQIQGKTSKLKAIYMIYKLYIIYINTSYFVHAVDTELAVGEYQA